MPGEQGRGDGVAKDVCSPLSASGQATVNGEMAHQDVHCVEVHVCGEGIDDPPHPIFVLAGVLVGILAHYVLDLDYRPG